MITKNALLTKRDLQQLSICVTMCKEMTSDYIIQQLSENKNDEHALEVYNDLKELDEKLVTIITKMED